MGATAPTSRRNAYWGYFCFFFVVFGDRHAVYLNSNSRHAQRNSKSILPGTAKLETTQNSNGNAYKGYVEYVQENNSRFHNIVEPYPDAVGLIFLFMSQSSGAAKLAVVETALARTGIVDVKCFGVWGRYSPECL